MPCSIRPFGSFPVQYFFLTLLVALAFSGLAGCSIDAEGNRVIGGPGFGAATLYAKPSPAIGIKDRSDVISKYFAQKELSPIEGVWVWDNHSQQHRALQRV